MHLGAFQAKGAYNKSMKQTPLDINFATTLYMLKDWLILPIPTDASIQLPSRGQVSVDLVINDHKLSTVLEPDGKGAHWLRVDAALQKELEVDAGVRVAVHLQTRSRWPEPVIPRDVDMALRGASEKVQHKWQDITPMARWEWVRWINATGSDTTRKVRIEKTVSKLEGAHRRPCCFNLTACTEPYVAKNGRLIEPTE